MTIARTTIARMTIAMMLGWLAPDAARAQSDSEGPRIERFDSRVALFVQEGRGLQSQATPNEANRGAETAWIFQPSLYTRIRQDRRVTWDITLPVDIVSAASPDALDAVSTASRYNEAGTLDLRTSIADGPSTYQLRYGAHLEEHFWSGFLGYSAGTSFADDNAQLNTSFLLLVDTFDPIGPTGYDRGLAHRISGSLNVSLSQLLSPTTVISGSYGFTGQVGTLATTYNSVPTMRGVRLEESMPTTRSRHAFSAELRQALPDTHTFLSGSYRFYVDDHDVMAHTARLVLTQEIGDTWIRGQYRFHTQSAPFYWTEMTDILPGQQIPRTADSDLEAFDGHEIGGSLRWFYQRRGALTAADSFFEIAYSAYFRSNDMFTHIGAIQWGQRVD